LAFFFKQFRISIWEKNESLHFLLKARSPRV